MRATFGCFLPACAVAGALSLYAQETLDIISPVAAPHWSCSAPYQTPAYTKPADDRVAFGRLLEASGYARGSNSDWVDIAAGNLCGGAEKELVLVKNKHSNFSILRGPAPYPVGTGDLASSSSHPWRAVAAGNIDAGPYDEIVAVRKISAVGVPDLVVARASSSSCDVTTVAGAMSIGNPSNSEWVDVAVGDFDGSGKSTGAKQIALVKSARSHFFFVKLAAPGVLRTFHETDLDSDSAYAWKALAAGDIDGDGIDELVAARHVTDGHSATVLVYKWSGSNFRLLATSTIGNTGDSDWASAAAGDFNADGRKAIVLIKNNGARFTLLDLPAGGTALRVLAASNLDSVNGQDWRGITAADWISGSDRGAAELIAVRAAHGNYATDLFVYGNAFLRIPHETGLDGTKSQYDQYPAPATKPERDALLAQIRASHTNTFNWSMTQPDDYNNLVELLEDTKDFCVDGKQLRVAVTLVAPEGVPDGGCSLPQDSPRTLWHELDFFRPGAGNIEMCKDTLGWASLISRLAQDYPHLVTLGIDDFSHFFDKPFTGEYVAELESRLRARSPWLNFVPTAYYSDFFPGNYKDIGLRFDSLLFFFRNEKQGEGPCSSSSCPAHKSTSGCLAGTCAEPTVENAVGEITDMSRLLAAGRKLQVGAYFGLHSTLGEPSPRYDYDLITLALNLPWIGGTTAYPIQKPVTACTEYNFLAVNNKYCALQKAYANPPQYVRHFDLSARSGAPPAAGDPFGYVFPAQGVQNVIYRATDGHAHELWRTATGTGHSDLSALARAPGVTGNPMAYVFPALGVQNVVYRGTDGHLHGLYWSTGAVGHDDLTNLSRAPGPGGDPYGYVFTALGVQNVLYRGTDGHLHGLYWSTGAVGHNDLTNLSHAPAPAGDPFAYVYDALGVQNALYRGTDGHLHGLYWSTGAVGHDDLTLLSRAPGPAGKPAAYIAPNYGLQNAVYLCVDGHIHGLYWSTGAVGHDDLTRTVTAPPPVGNPAAYFVAADGTHHVIYRGADAHLHELWWTIGVVTHNDLTALSGAPAAAGDPSAYLMIDGTQHVIYRSADGHLHDLTWKK